MWIREVRHQATTLAGAVPGICYVKLEISFAYQDGREPDTTTEPGTGRALYILTEVSQLADVRSPKPIHLGSSPSFCVEAQ